MPQLRQYQFRHRQLHRRGGSWHGENQLALGDASDGAAQHRAAADLGVAQLPKQFAKTGQGLVDQVFNDAGGFGRAG